MWRTSSSPAFVAARSSGCIVPVSLTGREWRPLPRSCVPPADTGIAVASLVRGRSYLSRPRKPRVGSPSLSISASPGRARGRSTSISSQMREMGGPFPSISFGQQALSVTLKRLVRARRIRLPLLFPPPVQIPEATQEFAMQLFCASTLRLGEVLLILRRRTGTAAAVRGLFDWMVNVYAILYLLQELLLSAQRCARDSTQVLAFKTC
ncbi:unnamed protein product [Durusdinium trenchii]|uniref:Uncharacterized protein n=2 Tax=Durusdinium trenchii TaxID=1381693 RepID=A0ABP0M2L4_9DINO